MLNIIKAVPPKTALIISDPVEPGMGVALGRCELCGLLTPERRNGFFVHDFCWSSLDEEMASWEALLPVFDPPEEWWVEQAERIGHGMAAEMGLAV